MNLNLSELKIQFLVLIYVLFIIHLKKTKQLIVKCELFYCHFTNFKFLTNNICNNIFCYHLCKIKIKINIMLTSKYLLILKLFFYIFVFYIYFDISFKICY